MIKIKLTSGHEFQFENIRSYQISDEVVLINAFLRIKNRNIVISKHYFLINAISVVKGEGPFTEIEDMLIRQLALSDVSISV